MITGGKSPGFGCPKGRCKARHVIRVGLVDMRRSSGVEIMKPKRVMLFFMHPP